MDYSGDRRPMREAFERFRSLDSKARKTFGRAVLLLPLVVLSLHWRGFKKTKESLAARLPRESQSADKNNAKSVEAISRMVKAAVRYGMVQANCLEESLVLWYLLRRRGLPAALRIGVRKFGDKFEAHAWVEYEGATLNQGEWTQPRYAAFEAEFSELPGEIS